LTQADQQLEEWLLDVIPRAVAYARTLVNPPPTAEELVQGVLCRLLEHEEYDLLADGEKLLFRSVTNACINAVTRRRQLVSLDDDAGEGGSLHNCLSSAGMEDPAEVMASRETLEEVERGLMELPETQRAAVELKAMGKSLKEIAALLEVSASNAGVLVYRGRKALKKKLGAKLPGELR